MLVLFEIWSFKALKWKKKKKKKKKSKSGFLEKGVPLLLYYYKYIKQIKLSWKIISERYYTTKQHYLLTKTNVCKGCLTIHLRFLLIIIWFNVKDIFFYNIFFLSCFYIAGGDKTVSETLTSIIYRFPLTTAGTHFYKSLKSLWIVSNYRH